MNSGIGRTRLDGGAVEPAFISYPGSPDTGGVAVNAGHVYWTDLDGRIGRANLDGSAVDETFVGANNQPCGVAVNATHLFYADIADGTIGRANIDGSPADDGFIPNAGMPCDVEVDATHIWWANRLANAIGRANLDGTNVEPAFIGGLADPCGVALDGEPVPPETVITKKPRKRTKKRKAVFRFASEDPTAHFECSLDRIPFSACSSPLKLKRLKRGKHRFEVRAIDAASNPDPTPAQRKWKLLKRR